MAGEVFCVISRAISAVAGSSFSAWSTTWLRLAQPLWLHRTPSNSERGHSAAGHAGLVAERPWKGPAELLEVRMVGEDCPERVHPQTRVVVLRIFVVVPAFVRIHVNKVVVAVALGGNGADARGGQCAVALREQHKEGAVETE